MAIVFPGDVKGVEPSRQFAGAHNIGGVEKYSTVSGNSVSITNLNAANITTGSLSGDRIAANTITANMISSNAVTADKISTNAVVSGKIDAGAVTTDKLAANAVTAAKITAGTITATELASNAVTADKIQANAVTASKIQAGSIGSTQLTSSLIETTSQHISGGLKVGGSGASVSGLVLDADNFAVSNGSSRLYVRDGSSYIFNSGMSFPNGKTITVSSDKSVIMPTSVGYRALYCMESPEVWFMDFAVAVKKRNLMTFWKSELIVEVDGLFREVTAPPYFVIQTDTKIGKKLVVQVWGKRIDRANNRFDEMSKKDFQANERFYSQARSK